MCEFAKTELLAGALFIEARWVAVCKPGALVQSMRATQTCGLQEFHCLRDGLEYSSLHEQALALDLLIGALVSNGFLASDEAESAYGRKNPIGWGVPA